MLIGIDASRAFQKNRTGIEEYSYQVIKHLRDKLGNASVVLYIKSNQLSVISNQDFKLPSNWEFRIIKFPYLWTQIGLSLEMLFHPIDILFIPAHIVPIIYPAHNASLFALALFIQRILKLLGVKTDYNKYSDAGGPKNTIVTVHGLEYEFYPKAYSFRARIYMRWAIKKSCRVAKKIIAVSQNTKKDLINLYKVPGEKVEVIYEGVNQSSAISHQSSRKIENFNDQLSIAGDKYLLFIGRLEERKNIIGIVETFKILKEKYKIPHKLVLAGKSGFGYENIRSSVISHQLTDEIIKAGFISEEEKRELLKNAEVLLFPTFYEGFGLPVLEAQQAGVPVVASNNSSIPEVADNSSLLVNSSNPKEIAEATYKLISDKAMRDDIIEKGYENVKRFSWDKCAIQITKLLNS